DRAMSSRKGRSAFSEAGGVGARVARRAAPLLVALAAFAACGRLQAPPPSGVPAAAVFDRRIGIWSHTSPEGRYTEYYASGILAREGSFLRTQTGLVRTG